jgi:V/A-type H+-transporting ATPase subunit K
MDEFLMQFMTSTGVVLTLSAAGSALVQAHRYGCVGAWKKNYSQNKPALFMLVAFVGAPITQTIYGRSS